MPNIYSLNTLNDAYMRACFALHRETLFCSSADGGELESYTRVGDHCPGPYVGLASVGLVRKAGLTKTLVSHLSH